jgi:broad specificity phosphatase PhoE
MPIIYWRHAHDEYSQASLRDDHRITEQGRKSIVDPAEEMMHRYGPPSLVVASPHVRTRETMDVMRTVLPRDVKFRIDARLARLPNNKKKEEYLAPELADSTLQYNPPLEPCNEAFKERVRKHAAHIVSRPDEVVWCITHSLVVLRIAKLVGIKTVPKTVPFMYSLVVHQDDLAPVVGDRSATHEDAFSPERGDQGRHHSHRHVWSPPPMSVRHSRTPSRVPSNPPQGHRGHHSSPGISGSSRRPGPTSQPCHRSNELEEVAKIFYPTSSRR